MAFRCGSCFAPILWAKVIKTGRKIPLDSQMTLDGTVEIGPDGAVILTDSEIASSAPKFRHVAHFATCPYAKSRRVKRTAN